MKMDWISVNDRMPSDNRNVIICLLGISSWVGHYNHGKKKWRIGNEMHDRKDQIVAITHWQPLPEPPRL